MGKRGYASLIWGGLLITLGLVLLAENLNLFGDLRASIWSLFLGAGGLLFLAIFVGDRRQRWALIPGLALMGIGGAIFLSEQGLVPDYAVATIILGAIALAFFIIFVSDRAQWWALIPAFSLTGSAAGVFLEEAGVISDEAVAAVIIGGVSAGFLVIYLIDHKQWWALIPGGILAVVAFFMLLASTAEYIWPLAIILLGIVLLRRALGGGRRRTRGEESLYEPAQRSRYDEIFGDEFTAPIAEPVEPRRKRLPTLEEQIAAATAEEPETTATATEQEIDSEKPEVAQEAPQKEPATEEPQTKETEPAGDMPSAPEMPEAPEVPPPPKM